MQGLLTSCVHRQIKLVANNTSYTGVVTQSIQFMYKKKHYQWVCYSEIIQQQIRGVSCQNDTALNLFSGGIIDGDFVYEYPSRYLLKIKPHDLVAYIKMSLFDDLSFNRKNISIDKKSTQAQKSEIIQITDHKRKIELTITVL